MGTYVRRRRRHQGALQRLNESPRTRPSSRSRRSTASTTSTCRARRPSTRGFESGLCRTWAPISLRGGDDNAYPAGRARGTGGCPARRRDRTSSVTARAASWPPAWPRPDRPNGENPTSRAMSTRCLSAGSPVDKIAVRTYGWFAVNEYDIVLDSTVSRTATRATIRRSCSGADGRFDAERRSRGGLRAASRRHRGSDDTAVVDALAGLGNLGRGSDSTVETYQMEAR